MTLAPSRAKRCAQARAMPDAPPVTSATRFFNFVEILLSGCASASIVLRSCRRGYKKPTNEFCKTPTLASIMLLQKKVRPIIRDGEPQTHILCTLGQKSMRLKGKVAVVTGSAFGLGRAVAGRFAREGAAVVAADIDAVEGAHAVEQM